MYVHIHASVSSFLHCRYLPLDTNRRKEKNSPNPHKAFSEDICFGVVLPQCTAFEAKMAQAKSALML